MRVDKTRPHLSVVGGAGHDPFKRLPRLRFGEGSAGEKVFQIRRKVAGMSGSIELARTVGRGVHSRILRNCLWIHVFFEYSLRKGLAYV